MSDPVEYMTAPWPPSLDSPKDEKEAAIRERNLREALAPYTVYPYVDDACVSSALVPSNLKDQRAGLPGSGESGR